MAFVRIRQSDASGVEIPQGTGARVRVIFNDPERGDLRCDLTDEEVERILPFAQPVEARPERRKSRYDTEGEE